jgi:hypothetical protein
LAVLPGLLPGLLTGLLAGLLAWLALVAPSDLGSLTPNAFLRIPLEGLVAVLILLVLPPVARRVTAVLIGLLLAVVLILKLLDLAFSVTLNRPVRPITDWSYVGSALGLLSDSVGRPAAVGGVVAGGLVMVAVFVLLPVSVLRLQRALGRHRPATARVAGALVVVWVISAALGLRLGAGPPLASTSAADLVASHVAQARADLQDRSTFARQVAVDPFRDASGATLLQGLRGKDVLVVFVESYGRVAVEGSALSATLDATLDASTVRLQRAGFDARSAFLTSPTFGGLSWLAHSTLQSGVWVDSQERYDTLVGSGRLTLSEAFQRAGWRTVGDVPANRRDWPQGASLYHFDQLYDARNVGYDGPRFGYAPMPDQYVLSAFDRLELASPHRQPVMAEIDLVSSHSPWAPLPRPVDWGSVGDGTVFAPMPAQGQSAQTVWRDPQRIRAAYEQSIDYSLATLASFLETTKDRNLVLVVLGDHQPATVVSGRSAGHEVPVTIIARDPAVMARISGWGWPEGMRPGTGAPVWRMDAFRDRFLSAFGP